MVAGLVAALVAMVALMRGHFFVGWWWIFKGFGAVGAGAGVKLAAKRARKTVRQLPDPEAIEILRPLAASDDETTRQVACEIMKDLRPEGTEVAAASAPDGAGSEIAPATSGEGIEQRA